MIVRVKKVELQGGVPDRLRGWLKKGKDYQVLSIEGGKYRIASEQAGTPALFDVELFDVVDAVRPESWVSRGADSLPASWTVFGFWEAFFDAEEWALEVYRKELRRK